MSTGRLVLPQSACILANCVTVGSIDAPVNTPTRYTSSTCSLGATASSTHEKLLKFSQTLSCLYPVKLQGTIAKFSKIIETTLHRVGLFVLVNNLFQIDALLSRFVRFVRLSFRVICDNENVVKSDRRKYARGRHTYAPKASECALAAIPESSYSNPS